MSGDFAAKQHAEVLQDRAEFSSNAFATHVSLVRGLGQSAFKSAWSIAMPARRPRRPHKLDDISRSPADESEELDAGPLIEPDADLSERVRLLAKLVRKNVLDQK